MKPQTPTDWYVAIFIVKLCTEPSKHSKPFLLCCDELQKFNHKTILCQLFNNAIGVLWPNGIIHNNVLLLLTDASSYNMCKMEKELI